MSPGQDSQLRKTARRRVKLWLGHGYNPNDIVQAIKEALEHEGSDWVLWEDGSWRLHIVCPECGGSMISYCGHKKPPVLRREYQSGLSRQMQED